MSRAGAGALKGLRGGLLAGAGLALAACATSAPPAASGPSKGAAAPAVAATGVTATGPTTRVITPAEPPPMAALARRLAMVIDGAKPQVTPFAVDLMALPRVMVPAALDAKEALKLDRSKLVEDSELTVKPADGYARQYMLSFGFKDPAKVSFAHVRVQGSYGTNEGWFGDGYGGQVNTYMTCGPASELVPLHWETVLMGKGEVTYTVSDGVLDRQSCRVLGVRRTVATAKPLLPKGILYGFRACQSSCTEGEELTVLFPRSNASAAGALGGNAERASGSFSTVSFPIQRGGGGAFMARVMRRDVVAWQLSIADDKSEPDKTVPILSDATRVGALFLSSFQLGVEVSQAHDDAAPVAIAYLDIDPASLPAPPAPPAAVVPPAKAASVPSPAARIGFNTSNQLDLDRR